MRGDGRNSFFKNLNLDKDIKKLCSWFIEIKSEMMKEHTDNYSNGRISKTE
jgi:hypothetical protein